MRTRFPLKSPLFAALVAPLLMLASCTHKHAALDLGLHMGGEAPVAVPLPLQQLAAVHEAAHAVAIVGYFGPRTVSAMMVRTSCCGGDVGYDVGATKPYVTIDKRNVDAYGKVMVMMYAGYEAELEFYGDLAALDHPDDHVVARNLAKALERELRDSGTPDAVAEEIAERTMRDARKEAREFVRLNVAVIRRLAGAVLMQPEMNGKLTLEGYEVHEALKDQVIRVPRTAVE